MMRVAHRSKAWFRLGAVKPEDHDEAGGKASIGKEEATLILLDQ